MVTACLECGAALGKATDGDDGVVIEYDARRQYCSPRCKKRAYRRRKRAALRAKGRLGKEETTLNQLVIGTPIKWTIVPTRRGSQDIRAALGPLNSEGLEWFDEESWALLRAGVALSDEAVNILRAHFPGVLRELGL